jgi:hypothetical protein
VKQKTDKPDCPAYLFSFSRPPPTCSPPDPCAMLPCLKAVSYLVWRGLLRRAVILFGRIAMLATAPAPAAAQCTRDTAGAPVGKCPRLIGRERTGDARTVTHSSSPARAWPTGAARPLRRCSPPSLMVSTIGRWSAASSWSGMVPVLTHLPEPSASSHASPGSTKTQYTANAIQCCLPTDSVLQEV